MQFYLVFYISAAAPTENMAGNNDAGNVLQIKLTQTEIKACGCRSWLYYDEEFIHPCVDISFHLLTEGGKNRFGPWVGN